MKLSRAVVAFVGLALCVIGNAFCSARAQTTTISISIDANANRHPINPLSPVHDRTLKGKETGGYSKTQTGFTWFKTDAEATGSSTRNR
jgi:hypothetical protein